MTAESLELRRVDGANPLGFLAGLGTPITVRQAGENHARLRWKRAPTWDETKRAATQREFDAANI
jgi:hypothetical protein